MIRDAGSELGALWYAAWPCLTHAWAQWEAACKTACFRHLEIRCNQCFNSVMTVWWWFNFKSKRISTLPSCSLQTEICWFSFLILWNYKGHTIVLGFFFGILCHINIFRKFQSFSFSQRMIISRLIHKSMINIYFALKYFFLASKDPFFHKC